MGASRTSFAKLQRDRAKKAKAAAKRERRLDKDGEPIESEDAEGLEGVEVVDDGEEISADQLLKMVEELHADFEAKRIDFETFEERKTELFARISVD
jgi:hypothetical protein